MNWYGIECHDSLKIQVDDLIDLFIYFLDSSVFSSLFLDLHLHLLTVAQGWFVKAWTLGLYTGGSCLVWPASFNRPPYFIVQFKLFISFSLFFIFSLSFLLDTLYLIESEYINISSWVVKIACFILSNLFFSVSYLDCFAVCGLCCFWIFVDFFGAIQHYLCVLYLLLFFLPTGLSLLDCYCLI